MHSREEAPEGLLVQGIGPWRELWRSRLSGAFPCRIHLEDRYDEV